MKIKNEYWEKDHVWRMQRTAASSALTEQKVAAMKPLKKVTVIKNVFTVRHRRTSSVVT